MGNPFKITAVTTLILMASIMAKGQTYTFDLVEQKLNLPQDTLSEVKSNSISISQNSTIMLRATPFKKIYHKSLGIFCHAENKMAKASKMPVKMRLGTVQYVDKIEGK